MENEITVNGITYRAVTEPRKRAVMVLDRGWIFAGDVSSEGDTITLTRAILVRSWSSIGFSGVVADPLCSYVKLEPMSEDVEFPVTSVIFRVPVGDDWGMK
jgi:hypothetical protein